MATSCKAKSNSTLVGAGLRGEFGRKNFGLAALVGTVGVVGNQIKPLHAMPAWAFEIMYSALRLPSVFVVIGMLALALVLPLRLFRSRPATIERHQLQICALGALAAFLPLAGLWGIPFAFRLDPLVQIDRVLILIALFPISVLYAIVRFHLFDIRIFVRKVLLAALLTLALSIVYALVSTVLGLALTGRTQPSLAGIGATVAVLAAFLPIRDRLQSKVDLIVEIPVDLRGQPGPIPREGHRPVKRRWRVVGLRNPGTGEYHLYLTNIPSEWLDADDIALSYQQRWEVELLFKELKGCFDLGAWKVAKEESVMVRTYGVLIAWALSRRLRADILGEDVMRSPRAASLAAPFLRFAKALAVHIKDIATALLAGRRAPRWLVPLLRRQARDPNRTRRALPARTRPEWRKSPAIAQVAG